MLRITTINEGLQTMTLKVEGRIVADWVETLALECERWLGRGKVIELDLSGVTFMDTQGVLVVRTLQAGEVGISNCPALIQSLLDEEDAP